jgi:hypothetical protein
MQAHPRNTPITEEAEETLVATAGDAPLSWRRAVIAIGIGVVLIWLLALGVRYTEMVTGRYIAHGVPPVPAFGVVLTFSLLRPLLMRHLPRLAPSRGQVLLLYAMLTVATILSGSYHVRAFLPHLVALQYSERPGGILQGRNYSEYLPAWLAPRDPQVVEEYYNGSRGGVIPWEAWLVPLTIWSLFLTMLFLGVYCLMLLVQKQWTQHEKLTFPLLNVPLAMTSENWSSYGPRPLRRSLFIFGCAIAVAFNGLNILHILYPSIPSPGFYLMLNEYFPNRPLQPLGSISIFFMLEAIGIGYFVPLEVSFSTWFFYLLNRLFAVVGTAAGYDQPGFPYTQDQSAGGYLAVGILLFWGVRHTFRESLHRSFRRTADPEARTERWAWVGFIGCGLFLLIFCAAAGFSLRLAVPFFLILLLYVIVFARIRAETGVPFGFIYPYGLPKESLLNAVGFSNALGWGGTRSIVMFSCLAWLSRHHFAQEHAAYQMDAMKLAQESRIGKRTLFTALIVAFLVGLGGAYWVHLSAYYTLGANMAGGGTGAGEFRAIVAQQEYQQMAGRLSAAPVQDIWKIVSLGGGFLFTTALYWLRLQWLGSPFHPLGFVLGTAYGDSSAMWFPLLIAWLLKACILKAGGLRLYRQGIPFFLGLTIGHFFMAGIFWPVFSLFVAPEASRAYHIYFGG